jgi:2-C-methyl-D-erythritol 4-phosphate cytidylyltransferase
VAVALVVAAGRGERLGSTGPKAFVVLGGRPMLEWSLGPLREGGCDEIVVAVPPGAGPVAGCTTVEGGRERSHSVRNALAASAGDPVVVHDAARPLVTAELVRDCVAAVREGADCALAAAPVVDTVKEVGADRAVRRTLDRRALWAVQTPQVFRRAALERALAQPDDVLAAATDDASLVEAQGGRVVVVAAPRENLKVTTPLDLEVAALLLAGRGRTVPS